MATASAAAPLGAQSWCSGCSTYADSKTLACGKCRLAWYHSKGCQLSSWPVHKQLCSKSLLWSLEALPADLLLCHRSVTPERIRGWVDGLLAPQIIAAKRREAVADLLRALPVLPHDAVGRLGLMPGLTRILSVSEEKDKGDAAAVTTALKVLVRCLQGSQLNARLLFLCGGAFELARLVFVALPADHPDLASALSALRATLVESQDAKCVQATLLGHGPPQQALVPVLLRLMDPAATAEGGCSPLRRLQQQQDAANLLSLALTLQAEAPREMWVEGFGVVARLVEEYLGVEGNGKVEGQKEEEVVEEEEEEAFDQMLRCLLLEVCGLVDGFVEHFPGAVESVIDKRLPALLDRLLGYPGALDVRADATVTARLALTFAGSQASVDALVREGKVLEHAGAMVAGAVADVMGAGEDSQAGSSGSSSSSRKEKKKAAAASSEGQRALARQQQQQGALILLKAGLASASDCLRADPALVAPHLPGLLPVIAAVVTTPALALARTQALACLLSTLVHTPRSVLLGGGEEPLLPTPAMGAGLGALLLLPLSPAGQQDNEQDNNSGGEENSPATLGLLAADAVALLASRFTTDDNDDDDDPAWAFLTKTVRALPVLSRQITAAATLPSKAGRPPPLAVARGAVLALQALLWARPATVLPELRADKALRAAVAVMAESGTETALDFAYLHRVLEAEGGEEVESLLEGTPVRTADWLEAVGLQRSAVQTVASERLLAYLGVRKEAVCAASGKELAAGDRVVRLSKCRHFLLEDEMRALVLTDDEGEEGHGYVRYWKGREAALEAPDERLRCPKCGRHMRVDVRD